MKDREMLPLSLFCISDFESDLYAPSNCTNAGIRGVNTLYDSKTYVAIFTNRFLTPGGSLSGWIVIK